MEKEESDGCSSLAYKLLFSCPFSLSPLQLSVVFDESYDRIPHTDINLEKSISEIWDQRVQKNPSLFNGKKFRYGGYSQKSGDGSNIESNVCLHLGLTDYRTFMGTNLNPLWEKFLVASEDMARMKLLENLYFLLAKIISWKSIPNNDATQCQHTSSPLGNGAIVETSDKKIVVLQRSNNVGEFPGHFVFPGGHPEPEEVGIEAYKYRKDSKESELVNRRVTQEMFDSIIREVVEEIGVPATSLSDPLFLGISRRVLNVRPAIFFFIKCSLESKEIQQLYSNAQDGYESTQLYTVSMVELEKMSANMPGCHQGGFALYKLMVEALKNNN